MQGGLLDAATRFINSPPGHITAGAVLAGVVWKLFKEVDDVLSEDAKTQVAIWLLDLKTAPTVQSWPETFASIVDQFFGKPRWSNKRLWITCVIFYVVILCNVFLARFSFPRPSVALAVAICFFFVLAVGTYGALVERRLVLSARMLIKSEGLWFILCSLNLLFDVVGGSAAMGIVLKLSLGWVPETWSQLFLAAGSSIGLVEKVPTLLLPLLLWSLSLWIYGAAGLLIKATRSIDGGLGRFTRWFDIERKPLNSIGLVAGALVAGLYWGAVVVRHFI